LNLLDGFISYVDDDLLALSYSDAGFKFQDFAGIDDFEDPNNVANSRLTDRKVDPPHVLDEFAVPSPVDKNKEGPYLLRWQTSPTLRSSQVNIDVLEMAESSEPASICLATESAVLSGFIMAPPGSSSHEQRLTSFFATLRSIEERKAVNYLGDPMAFLMLPIFDSFSTNNRKVVGVLESVLHWKSYLVSLLPSNIHGIVVVLENSCDVPYTYEIRGAEAYVIGAGDRHDTQFDYMEQFKRVSLTKVNDGTTTGIRLNQGKCPYSVHVYPSKKFYYGIVTNFPITVSCAVGMVFLLTIVLFICYDRLVERRQRLVLAKATQSTAIVSCR
jgi:hypothetical protein